MNELTLVSRLFQWDMWLLCVAGLSEGGQYGGGEEVASQAAERALAAEQAQHGAAARAAAKAAYQLAGQQGEQGHTEKTFSSKLTENNWKFLPNWGQPSI